MTCDKCSSKRIVRIDAKCSDLARVTCGQFTHDGYIPKDMGVGGGDYIAFSYCLDCGKIQGSFPVKECSLEQSEENSLEQSEENMCYCGHPQNDHDFDGCSYGKRCLQCNCVI